MNVTLCRSASFSANTDHSKAADDDDDDDDSNANSDNFVAFDVSVSLEFLIFRQSGSVFASRRGVGKQRKKS